MSMLLLGVGRLQLTVCHKFITARPQLTEAVLCLHKLTSVNSFQSVGAWPHQIRFLGEAEIACLSPSINQPVSCLYLFLLP